VIRAVLDENLICRTFPLSVKPADVRIAPAEEFFMKRGLGPCVSKDADLTQRVKSAPTQGLALSFGEPCPLDPSRAFSSTWSSPKRKETTCSLFLGGGYETGK